MPLESIAHDEFILFPFASLLFDISKFLLCRYTKILFVLNSYQLSKLKIIRHIYTLLFVVLGWVIFRSDTLIDALNYLGVMFGSNGVFFDTFTLFYCKENIVYFVLGVICCTPVIMFFYHKIIKKWKVAPVIASCSLIVIAMLSIIYTIKGTYNPFIYFNF